MLLPLPSLFLSRAEMGKLWQTPRCYNPKSGLPSGGISVARHVESAAAWECRRDVHCTAVLCCQGQQAMVTVGQRALQKGRVWRRCTTTEHAPTLCFILPAAGEHFSFYCSLPILLMPLYKNYNLIIPARKVKYLKGFAD